MNIRHFWAVTGFKEEIGSRIIKSCRVFCECCLRLDRAFRTKTELNWLFKVFALSVSSEEVIPLAVSEANPLDSCFECFMSEYSFLVLTLGGVSRSSLSLFNPRMLCRYFS